MIPDKERILSADRANELGSYIGNSDVPTELQKLYNAKMGLMVCREARDAEDLRTLSDLGPILGIESFAIKAKKAALMVPYEGGPLSIVFAGNQILAEANELLDAAVACYSALLEEETTRLLVEA